jgi:phospholipase C
MPSRLVIFGLMLLLTLPLGASASGAVPNASTSSIKHIIIIEQENHTFDNFFGTFPGANGIQNDPPMVHPFPITEQVTKDLNHSWEAAHDAYDNGTMNGFLAAEQTGETFGYYTQSEIPYYWSLAKGYTLFDDFFSSVMGPSLPNHVALIAAQSGGVRANGYATFSFSPVMTELDSAGISWEYYAGYAPTFSGWNALPGFIQYNSQGWDAKLAASGQILDAIKAGNLPQVSWVMPPNDSSSDHPPYSLAAGQKWVESVVSAIQGSKYWSSSAIFLSWDDYGGWYDHVPPPQVSPNGDGFRVPLILISPFAKNGYVDHTLSDDSSLVRFIEDNFNLGNLGAGDATANDLTDSFRLGTPHFDQALTLTTALVGSDSSGDRVLNVTYRDNYYMNIRGEVSAIVRSGDGDITSYSYAPVSINPTRSAALSLPIPGVLQPQNTNYTVTLFVTAPDGSIASRPYTVFILSSSVTLSQVSTSSDTSDDS